MKVIITSKIGNAYGASDGKNIYLNPKKNRSGIERLDTILHEDYHNHHPQRSEKDTIQKTKQIRDGIMSLI